MRRARPPRPSPHPLRHPCPPPRALQRRVPSALAFVLGLLVTATMGMLLWQRSHRAPPAGADGSRVVAVLPFENLGAADQEYFADGVTDAIRGKLAAIPGLQVIARSSSSPYKGSGKSPTQIADELGAQYLLTGTVRWERGASGNRVQVSPELVQIRSGGAPTTQWQQPFSAGITDVFQVQGGHREAGGRGARPPVGREPARGAERAADGEPRGLRRLPARRGALRNGGGDPSQTRAAIRAYERAVALDTGFVLAWANLSRANSQLYGNAGISADVADRARDAAQRAMALGPERPEALLALGDYYSYVPGDNAKALEQYALAQRSAPNNAEILSGAALSELSLGRWEESLTHFRQALALDPRAARTAARLARTLLFLRRYPEALAASDRAIALAPATTTVYQNKVMVYLAQGDLESARRVIASAPPSLDPTTLVANLAQFWDLYWVLDDARQQLLLRLTPAEFDGSREGWGLALASTYALRGDMIAGPGRTPTRPGSRSRASLARRKTPSCTSCSAPRWPIWDGRTTRCARVGARWRCCPWPRTRSPGPTSSTSSPGSTSWWVSPMRRSTSSSRCSRCRISCRPAGCGSTRRSIRCGSILGSSGCSRGPRDMRRSTLAMMLLIFPAARSAAAQEDVPPVIATIGLQFGGQAYSEVVLFQTRPALDNFKQGHLKLDAQASAIAVTARASADLAYRNGVAIVTMAKGGLMYEASVGGQKFSFTPVGK